MRIAGATLTAVGTVVGLAHFFAYIPSIGWGPPGSAAYEAYSYANRLFAVVLLVILTGTVLSLFGRPSLRRRVVFAGALLMLIGNVAEFWIFNANSYEDSARLAAWLTFLLGAALFFVTLGWAGVLWLITRAGITDKSGDAASG